MPASIVRKFRLYSGLLLVALLLLQGLSVPSWADDLADFRAAVEEASEQYNVALTTLETRDQAETAAEVQRFRDAWRVLLDRFGSRHPAGFTDESYRATLLDIDLRIIGVLLVIDMGNRDAARAGLTSIHGTLLRLSDPPPPQ